MGSIPFNPEAKILEPNQRALIACNGKEQILILSTDLKADRDTKILEIMSLPSEPSITNANVEIFIGQMRERIETPEEKVARVVKEDVAVVPYDPQWPKLFQEEKQHLLSCLPATLIKRIEHFGSTAVPGLSAKPIVDMLIEVTSLDTTKVKIPPILEAQGYDYFWRPTRGDDTPPFYAWFINRDSQGNRTHHIHMVEAHFEHWDRLLFRDYLVEHPHVAQEYGRLKQRLSDTHPHDRVAYTEAKTDFVVRVTKAAKEYYRKKRYDAQRSR